MRQRRGHHNRAIVKICLCGILSPSTTRSTHTAQAVYENCCLAAAERQVAKVLSNYVVSSNISRYYLSRSKIHKTNNPWSNTCYTCLQYLCITLVECGNHTLGYISSRRRTIFLQPYETKQDSEDRSTPRVDDRESQLSRTTFTDPQSIEGLDTTQDRRLSNTLSSGRLHA